MKTFHLIMQAKGGVGKSMLTYFYALQMENDASSLFIDTDNSTKTSDRQLAFLRGRPEKRLAKLSLFADKAKQDRMMLVSSILELAKLPYTSYFLDFGAPESEQFPPMVQVDTSATLLKKVEQKVQGDFVFHIVIGGNTAFKSSLEYLIQIIEVLEGKFQIVVHPNQFSFIGPARAEQQTFLENFCQQNNLHLVPFGNIDPESSVGKQIVHYAQQGKGLDDFDFFERLLIDEQIEQLKIEQYG
jgi:hypothetical protein